MKVKFVFIISGFLLLWIAGMGAPSVECYKAADVDSSKAKHGKKHAGDDKLLGDVENPAMLLEAKKEALIGNSDKAFQLFSFYVQRYPNDPAGKFELARLQAGRGKYDDAYELTQDAIRLDPNNKYYQLFLAEVCQLNKMEKEAIAVYENLIKKYPGELDYYFQLGALYMMVGEEKKAAEVYDQIEAKAGIAEEISIQKEKIYLHLGNIEKAEKELQNLVTAFPDDSRYLSMLAEFYMSNNQF